ncbi:hypothetical protein [Kribbella deserti]|uniref:Uncharacterized protein n=1 Tax=Kribbella deserti TaxID=1926257 RepID=A0ABV6QF56_9ACTN
MNVDAMKALLGSDAAAIFGLFDQLDEAEDEIRAAMRRHPDSADTLWHSMSLLQPTPPLGGRHRAFSAHCRELLERVAAGTDTRLATDAEMLCALLEAALAAPLNSAGYGLAGRLWNRTFPSLDSPYDDQPHYESLYAARIDADEADLRRRLSAPDRVLGEIHCHGFHHGRPVDCSYAPVKAAAGDAA